jgi:citrate lyase subunit beta/citryl-CoA lyase
MAHRPTPSAHLYVPGDQSEKLAKANGLPLASVVVDLEDAVVLERKDSARAALSDTVATLAHVPVWVRINQGETGLVDLEHILSLEGVEGVWVPKAEPGDFLDTVLTQASRSGALRVGVLIESAVGYIARNDLLSHPLVSRVQLGEYDFRADTGFDSLTPDTFDHLTPLRTEIVMSAVANGLEDIIGPVSADFRDLGTFQHTTQFLFDTGHTSRACIHPAQVNIVNTIGSPTEKDIAWATQTIHTFAENEKAGVGAYSEADGEMADKATVRRAERILARSNKNRP